MKTRNKLSPSKSTLIETNKKERQKRDVDKVKVALALNELIQKGGSSIFRMNDEDCKTLTKRFKVSEHIIRNKIAELQPIVSVKKM